MALTNAAPEPADDSADRFPCGWEGCHQTLTSQQGLVDHVTAEHVQLASNTYRCLWRGCSRRRQGFNARYKMFVHIRTHTKERPHVCLDCGKGFSRQENLKIHKRSHTGEKPYACTFEGCDRAYSNSSDRFKHTRTHFVDRPYACKFPGCSKSYTDPSSLRKHMKANGHSRPASPLRASEPPGRKPGKLKRAACREMTLASDAADSPGLPLAAPLSPEASGCACGRTPGVGWEPWLWYPWVHHVGSLLGCQTAPNPAPNPVVEEDRPPPGPAPLDLRVPTS